MESPQPTLKKQVVILKKSNRRIAYLVLCKDDKLSDMPHTDAYWVQHLHHNRIQLESDKTSEEKLAIIAYLEKVPMKVTYLEQTRIARAINNLRKFDPDQNVAMAAKDLLFKWQEIATAFYKKHDEYEAQIRVAQEEDDDNPQNN